MRIKIVHTIIISVLSQYSQQKEIVRERERERERESKLWLILCMLVLVIMTILINIMAF